MAEIKDVRARSIIDSRGIPTVEAEIILTSGVKGRASVPSGASTGSREAVELRDGGQALSGKGVEHAVRNINTTIKTQLVGHDARHQRGIDDLLITLDGTENKSRLGANAILAISIAVARAAAQAVHLPFYHHLRHIEHIIPAEDSQTSIPYVLPVPLINIINGGAHADNSLDIQEFMIIPIGAKTFKEAMQNSLEVFHVLKGQLKQRGLLTSVGDEGGFAPNLPNNEKAMELIMQAIEQSGFKPGIDIALGLDIASTEFYQSEQYHLNSEKRSFTSEEFSAFLMKWVNTYPIISIEDGMAENDWLGWKILTEQLGNKCQLVGDDIFVTNTNLLNQGILENVANAILIKPNQIGTLTETFAAIKLAKESNYATIISHRSGETEDTLIADLAVSCNAGQIKAGSLSRSERTAKYNQLLRIEEELGAQKSQLYNFVTGNI